MSYYLQTHILIQVFNICNKNNILLYLWLMYHSKNDEPTQAKYYFYQIYII